MSHMKKWENVGCFSMMNVEKKFRQGGPFVNIIVEPINGARGQQV
jgi:hypothetical protein